METLMLRGTKKRVIVGRFENSVVVMQQLTDSQLAKMEEEKLKNGAASFKTLDTIIPSFDVLLYGKINFNDKNDKNLIKRFETRLWDPLDSGHFIYSNYDTNSGIVFKDKKLNRFIGCTCGDIIQWVRYCHNIIGRPKNIIIYKFSRGKYNVMCPGFFKTL